MRRRQRIPMGWEEIGWKWMGGDRRQRIQMG
jgi:hypothetical protein